MPYNSNSWVRNIIKSLMALPLLHQHLIEDQFDQVTNAVHERLQQAKVLKRTAANADERENANEDIRLCQLLIEMLDYFENYWINKITPDMFCVQGLEYRTNNFAEGMSTLS